MTDAVLLAHAAATWYMIGLVWFVQGVHYPLFGKVGVDAFPVYQAAHLTRTGPVVVPGMLVELGCALALLLFEETRGRPAVWMGAALLAVVWLSTAFLQVPAHRSLERRFESKAWRRLVVTNWLRTAAWSTRGALALWMLADGTTGGNG